MATVVLTISALAGPTRSNPRLVGQSREYNTNAFPRQMKMGTVGQNLRSPSILVRRRSMPLTRCDAESEDVSGKASASPATASPPKGPGQGFGKAPPPVSPPRKETKTLDGSKTGSFSKPSPPITRRGAPERPLLGSEQSSEQEEQMETAIVATLGLIFVIILTEGLFLASSGFLPEEWDTFALDTIYPAFSPTVGLFLLIAAGYGLYKFLGPQK